MSITLIVDEEKKSETSPFFVVAGAQVMDEDDNSKKLLLDEHQVSHLIVRVHFSPLRVLIYHVSRPAPLPSPPRLASCLTFALV